MSAAQRDETTPDDVTTSESTSASGSTLRAAELDALRAKVRELHGDDIEAWLRAVFDQEGAPE